jgi:hypothetical protein
MLNFPQFRFAKFEFPVVRQNFFQDRRAVFPFGNQRNESGIKIRRDMEDPDEVGNLEFYLIDIHRIKHVFASLEVNGILSYAEFNPIVNEQNDGASKKS